MKGTEAIEKPYVVKSHDIHIDADYAKWIADVKHRYRSAQIKAAVRVNAEKLIFNWELGRDLVQKKAEERWGSGVVEQISLDLRREFPTDGFSTSNLWYMKKWYLFYTSAKMNPTILQRLIGEFKVPQNESGQKLHQVGGELPMPFAKVPWRHHIEIITKCKTIEEALFYINQTIEHGLSRAALVNCIKADLYLHKGKIINNFSNLLPAPHSKLAQEVLKENYDFGFAAVEHEIYDETELEEALTKNITNLLLEMGNGFAFIGRQKEFIAGGHARRIDLLFYHIRLRCYIVCELKAKPFQPEYAGKLNFYVNAIDNVLKQADDNPTIGLLVCSDLNTTEVQWAFKGIETPMGVATYNNIKIKDALPSREQLTERVNVLQKELLEKKLLMKKTLIKI